MSVVAIFLIYICFSKRVENKNSHTVTYLQTFLYRSVNLCAFQQDTSKLHALCLPYDNHTETGRSSQASERWNCLLSCSETAEQAFHFLVCFIWRSAYLSQAFNLQVPTKVRVPCVHMLERKDKQPCYKQRNHQGTSWRDSGNPPVPRWKAPARPGRVREAWRLVHAQSSLAFETFVSPPHPHACSDEANWSQDTLNFLQLHILRLKYLSGIPSPLKPHFSTAFKTSLPLVYRFCVLQGPRPLCLPVNMLWSLTWASVASSCLSSLFLSPCCSITGRASLPLPYIFTTYHPALFLYEMGRMFRRGILQRCR